MFIRLIRGYTKKYLVSAVDMRPWSEKRPVRTCTPQHPPPSLTAMHSKDGFRHLLVRKLICVISGINTCLLRTHEYHKWVIRQTRLMKTQWRSTACLGDKALRTRGKSCNISGTRATFKLCIVFAFFPATGIRHNRLSFLFILSLKL